MEHRSKIIDYALYAFFYLSSLVFIFNTDEFEGNAALYPRVIAATVILLTTILVLRELSGKAGSSKQDDSVPKKLYVSSILSVLYVGLVSVVGYFIATPIFIVSLSNFLGFKNIKATIITCIVLELVIYLAFKVALGVPVPSGILFPDF